MTADIPRMRHLIAFLLLLAAVPARAGGIVLEAYTGERPADASRLISPIFDELAARGFSGGDTLARTYDGKVSRPSQTAQGMPADFAAQVDLGFKAWVAGRFEDAIKQLAPLVEAAHANTGVIAKDQSLRDPLLKAMIALALSQQRTGDPGAARATFAEILRGYPDAQLPRATYGAEAFDLFEQVRHEVAGSGKGKLVVDAAEDGAIVFVDELYRAVAGTPIELVPGEYRVCVLADKRPSRSHRVVVRANDTVKLHVDVALDRTLHTTGWTGFAFATGGDRETHEGPYAAQVATVVGATAVAVVGIDIVRGRPAIVGSLVSLSNGREIRRASVAMEPDPSTERLKALARYLAGDEPAAGLEVQTPGAAPTTAPAETHDEAPSRGRWGGWKWLATGGAVVALGVGGYLAYEDGRCQDTPAPGTPCSNIYATSPADYVVLGTGAVLTGVAIYLFATGGTSQPAHTAFVAPTSGGAMAGFTGHF